jgi:hypothetical protein
MLFSKNHKDFKDTSKTSFEEEKSIDKEYKSFAIGKATQKSNLEGRAPLHTVKEHWCSVPSSRGALECSVPLLRECWPFMGKIWFVEGNQGRIPSISEGGWIRI